tara:strand:- start:3091 stop:4452 length:1362 start_codon:yes stop_codon:yes gene_type:complete
MKSLTVLRKIQIPGVDATLSILGIGEDLVFIERKSQRSGVVNKIQNYEYINSHGESTLKPLTIDFANEILDRSLAGVPYSSIFIFYENGITDETYKIPEKSEQEHKYTSTGIKFWKHQEQMLSYRGGGGDTVISTHISPEGACNLKCPYCSVTYRDTHSRLDLDTIKDYVTKLITRGLKAVILTGGGEPTAYPHINELVKWLKYEKGLSVALITNGTIMRRLDKEALSAFSWIRVSINTFKNWETRIGANFDLDSLSNDCVVGCSMVYTVEHEGLAEFERTDRLEILNKVSAIADRIGAKYIRLLPNCLLRQEDLIRQHKSLDILLEKVSDKRFFHQYKVHGAPKSKICHQAYFRPYLSEEPFGDTGKPGTVYPCDSVVLNNSYQHFAKQYQLCKPEDILNFLDDRKMNFDPSKNCEGCVFTENVNMLEDWSSGKIDKFSDYAGKDLEHEEFV